MIDPEAVCAALATLEDAAGERLVDPHAVGEIQTEPGWLAVAVTMPGASRRELLEAVHRHLTAAFPGTDIELRTESRIYRGGVAGFGPRRHVLVVLGGKGGVGKSTLSVNLALTLSAMGLRVGLLDGDLSGPDIPHMLGIHARKRPGGTQWRLGAQVTPPSQRIPPVERLGLEVMSIGLLVSERAPLSLTSRWLVSALLRNLLFEVAWRADVVVLDAPPGTGEELQVMASELPISGAVFVTTPQDLAQMDAGRTLSLLREHNVPILGMVQNMAELTCPHCHQTVDLFAQSSRLVEEGVPLLARIPFDVRLAVNADRGQPLLLGDPTGAVAHEFARIGASVRAWIANSDHSLEDGAALR